MRAIFRKLFPTLADAEPAKLMGIGIAALFAFCIIAGITAEVMDNAGLNPHPNIGCGTDLDCVRG